MQIGYTVARYRKTFYPREKGEGLVNGAPPTDKQIHSFRFDSWFQKATYILGRKAESGWTIAKEAKRQKQTVEDQVMLPEPTASLINSIS